MPTEVELKIGLNMEIGSVPLSLEVDIDSQADKSIYTFDGCVQDAVIPLGSFMSYVGQQFAVGVQLPPEIDFKATIDYLAGQVIYTKPTTGAATTELGAAGRFEFELNGSKPIVFNFYADVILGGGAPAAGNPYVVGASIDLDLDFSKIPLVGSIPGFDDLILANVGFTYTNAPGTKDKPVTFHIPKVSTSANPLYTRKDPDAKNAKDYTIAPDGNQKPFSLTSGGFALTAGFQKKSTGEVLNNFALPMALPAAPPPPAQYPPPAPFYKGGTTSPPNDSVHWIDVNKTFGPVSLEKIGLNYSGGEATFGFTAGFSMGGFSLGLEGMTITFPLPLPGMPAGHTVSFDLQGLTFDIKQGGFEIGGAFLKVVAQDVTSYYGEVLVQVGNFGLKALGGYTPAHVSGTQSIPASFFIYANIDVPLGGPPYLFVNGLAGGFGINNSLILPTLDELPTYILLPHNAPAEGATPKDTITAVLPQLQKYFQNLPGQYWVAAGIQFSSFEMINAFALVTVSFGVSFQVGLLGSCSMNFPTGAPKPIAYVEIDILASFTPATGLLAVEGKLSPASFLFGDFCQLTGGFAFYIWFAGPHKDEFVVTLGGYHPAFNPPDYYPKVPRLGLNFSLGPFQVTGGCYFALTPSMFMAGASMKATWDISIVKAWFSVGADFLIAWAPFHYEADAYVNIGCSVKVGLFTLNLHAGADLTIWGPPFGGKADVDLDVVSFTISFGADPAPPAPVGWKSFKESFLPQDTSTSTTQNTTPVHMRAMLAARTMAAPAAAAASSDETNIIKAGVFRGLITTNFEGYNWVVNPQEFTMMISTTIPVNAPQWATGAGKVFDLPTDPSQYNGIPTTGPALVLGKNQKPFDSKNVWNPTVDIRPMKLDGVTSTFVVTLLKRGSGGVYSEYQADIRLQPITADAVAALWLKAGDKPNPNEQKFAKGALTTFQLTPIPRHPTVVNGVPLIQLLFQQGNIALFSYTGLAVNPNFKVGTTFPTKSEMDIQISGTYTASIPNKGNRLEALENSWVVAQRNEVLADLLLNDFTTYAPGEVAPTIFATQTALTDWPKVLLLGDKLSA